jgi:hypothetical protein
MGWDSPDGWTPSICPGTPLTFTHFALANRAQSDNDLGEIQLKDYLLVPQDSFVVVH